ncbi:hypothetical protein [Paenibacillus sp. FSL K6-1318]|uniref:hypothetical protein n=1 Tax=Paenibacillus sp. FSL K6-1318 TaxID=2975291 RepID=UPI0030EC5764
MKNLTAFGVTFEAQRIVKTSDSIIGYSDQTEVFAFRGISDFTGYEIEGEYDDPLPDISQEMDLLKQQLSESKLENQRLAAESNANQLALMELHMLVLSVVSPDES